MSDHTIDHGKSRLEIEWDIDRETDPPIGIYILIADDHALTDIAVTVDVNGAEHVVKRIDETKATGCIRLSIDEARSTRDAIDKAIADAQAHHCARCKG